MAEVLETEDRGAVRLLWMNRPDKLNALDTALTQALHDGLLAADAADGVRAVGAGGARPGASARGRTWRSSRS